MEKELRHFEEYLSRSRDEESLHHKESSSHQIYPHHKHAKDYNNFMEEERLAHERELREFEDFIKFDREEKLHHDLFEHQREEKEKHSKAKKIFKNLKKNIKKHNHKNS